MEFGQKDYVFEIRGFENSRVGPIGHRPIIGAAIILRLLVAAGPRLKPSSGIPMTSVDININ
ncbi:hypothetical protein ACLOJK_034003 [Asimina triloba]